MLNALRWPAIAALGLLVLVFAVLTACQRAMIYYPNKVVVAPRTPGVEAVRIATPDGETLVAWHARARAGQPTFLFFDGNGGAPEGNELRWREIVAHGAGFLAVYYRGYSGSTGKPTEAGLHTDARAGYDWLVQEGVPPSDIVIHGLSLGSGVATKLASERPARALVLEAPYTAAVDVARLRYPWLPVGMLMQDQFRSRDWIGAVDMPVLIVHGDRDSVIPFAQGQRLYELAKEPKRFVRIEGGEHNTLVEQGLYAHVWNFLER
ncbi:MAG: alpha/beta hydrolase [Hyphomonadaceae bacterium]|nr:alpha/beta hydrolase [Hyphomonadaceae bacterium]